MLDWAVVAPRLAPRDLALVLAVVALWGFSFVPIKVGLEEIPPFAFAALRFFLAAVPLVFFVPPPRVPARLVIAYGLAIGVFQFGLLFLGMKLGMPAGLASLVIQLQVFFTIGLGIAFLGDRLHSENVIGGIAAGIGVALLALHQIGRGADSTLVGLALVIVAAVAWAIGNIVAKHAARHYHADMLGLVVWSSLAPPLPLLAASYAFEGGPAAWHAIASAGALTWGCALFLAYLATIFGFGSWARMLHRYPTGLVAPFALLVPVSGLASGAVFLGESLAPLQLAGAGLVLAGLAVNVYGARLGSRRAGAAHE
ncbi:MAG: EamA family transporter [Betaproteobacteria bacterium]|nr:EamA family transporter [Betaproteobacteria bacterium]MDE2004145.1 EamA family transporter [Betaproteobacteria bacterium]MDE2210382.1 EamA family transporter [Betaproteobacteria bacterium]MDE2358285.1 EamA family transporter [Betaproteobacteria bacterium]